MRIAITTETNQGPLSKVGHDVGRSPYFAFADVIGAEITDLEFVSNPALERHDPEALASFVEAKGASVLISGGLGRHTREHFEARGVQRATRASGTVQDAVRDYLAGRLPDDDAAGCGCGYHDRGDHEHGNHGGHRHPHDPRAPHI